MSYLAVDPGIRGTGLALFSYSDMYPKLVANICPRSEDTWEVRAHYVCTLFEEFLHKHRPADVYIEQPQFLGMSREGIMCARNGDLVKLSMLSGALFWCASSSGCKLFLLTPQQWKYKTSKEKSHAVIRSKLPLLKARKYTEHELDAIGIGLYAAHMERR